ncbi:MAG: VCBS repeat-containing protein [Chloroflexi bacterium]|nr:VCBS repeat-containing protein [Chloroflexota bacterium]
MAWGDYDGDGDLDLAVGNDGQPNRLYRNNNGVLTASAIWASAEVGNTRSLAWGDYDRDGDLDLAVGNDDQPNRVYRNDNGMLTTNAIWSSVEVDHTTSVAWGDYDGDGDLDLAIGNCQQPIRLYRNDNGMLTTSAAWSSNWGPWTSSVAWGDFDGDGDLDLAVSTDESHFTLLYRNNSGILTDPVQVLQSGAELTRSVAWGDFDGDGDQDLAVGNDYYPAQPTGLPNLLYRNDNGILTDSPVWSSGEADRTYSVAWGDYDGDGDLDLAAGNNGQPNRIYQNDNGMLSINAIWSSVEEDYTRSVAWGDYDGDGDLDLAVGNFGQPNRLYRNDSSPLNASAVWSSVETWGVNSVAWGDYDGDGDLDLATGADVLGSWLYRNDNSVLTTDAVWHSMDAAAIRSIAWGDYDGDGDLDLAASSDFQPTHLYRNDSGTLTPSAVWSSAEVDSTQSLAWGDYDGDGDLDLAAGNFGQPNRLYRNDNGILTDSAVWSSAEVDSTESVAWGDYDGDGDLDLVVGNYGQPTRLYRNDGGSLTASAVWSSVEAEIILSVAWGDYDADGDLDLAVGNYGKPNRLYRNDNGMLTASAIWSSVEADRTQSVTWGDYDGDGDLDLAVGNYGQPNRLYRNDGGSLTASAVWSSVTSDYTTSVAWGDYDADGDLDLAVGNTYSSSGTVLYANAWNARTRSGLPGVGVQPTVRLVRPTPPGNAAGYSAPNMWPAADATIAISYTLSQPASQPVATVRGYYSPDGGGRWLPAVAASGTITKNLATSPSGVTHLYNWDVFASGFFGRSDNVVFRIVVVPDLRSGRNAVPGPYLFGSNASDTYPFRVRGSQVRVMEDGVATPGALVYRLPAGQAQGAEPMVDRAGQPFKTDSQGYLQGRGTIATGDRLLALAPVTTTEKYTLYFTNAQPTVTGLDAYTVTTGGVQPLAVSAANPLLLFNLDVSLEWDASNETAFLARLQTDLVTASRAIYDWTNGQVALGRVTIYQAKERWAEADVQILASNQVRPNSARGGIVTGTTTLPLTPPVTVGPGAVRIGPTWNRYGRVDTVGEDWPRVLAHELAHYALFLEDTYIGLDADGLLVPVSSCSGTAMSDPYQDGASEFRYDDGAWFAQCGASLAEQPEWDILTQTYPALHAPPPTNGGPNAMPFAFTQIEVKAPPSAGAVLLDDTNVQLEDPELRLAGGRAFLVQPGIRIVDLGRPVGDTVLARGARQEDELCVFAAGAFDCKSLSNTVPALLAPRAAWRPQITVTPVNTTTLRIQTGDLDGASSVTLTVFPGGEASVTATLQPTQTQEITLSQPATDVFLDFSGSNADQRLISGYWLGSGPGRTYSYGGPYTSGDGGVSVYPPQNLANDDFMVLQTPLAMPPLPPGRMLIGRPYEIRAGSGSNVFTGGSVTFQYLGLDVLLSGLPEQFLKVFYWDGSAWNSMRTVLNTTQNFASAPLPGPGVYALLVSAEMPLPRPGWNDFGYTLQETQPVTVALRSIAGYYTTVYSYDSTGPNGDYWKMYSVGVPDWVNDLRQLEYGHAYWIQVTTAITLCLSEGSDATAAGFVSLPDPPATYYGSVAAGRDFAPAAGMPVRAYVNGRLCGRGETQRVDGQIVYVVDVDAGGGGTGGCGASGSRVEFEVGAQHMDANAPWDNDHVHRLVLGPASSQRLHYLPMILGTGIPTSD